MEALPQLNLAALFLLGFLGSGHCVGMCGPLVLAFPARQKSRGGHLAYHMGRIGTYTLLGALLGSLGASLTLLAGGAQEGLVWTARIQVGFAVLAALFLGMFGLSKLGFLKEPRFLALATPARIPGFRSTQKRLMAGGGGLGSTFLIGALLGLLPCGLSFAAFARALAAGGPLEGGLMALAFGLGTLPSLLLVGLSASKLSQQHRRTSDLIAGVLMVGMAAALVLDVADAWLG